MASPRLVGGGYRPDMDGNDQVEGPHEMTPAEKRRDQLLSAPGAVESDAAPRIEVSEHDGVTRIDIAANAQVRPGDPYQEPESDR
jgi:hypothetical protein